MKKIAVRASTGGTTLVGVRITLENLNDDGPGELPQCLSEVIDRKHLTTWAGCRSHWLVMFLPSVEPPDL